MKKMHLLFIGGRQSGKTTFAVRSMHEALQSVPNWLNLKFAVQQEVVPGALSSNWEALQQSASPKPMHDPKEFEFAVVRVRKKRIFWFAVLMELFRKLLFWTPITEIGGIQIRAFEMSVENPRLGEWLLKYAAKRTPLGVILVVDPFAVGKTCDSRHEPTVSAVTDRLVERFEQIFVGNPEKRLPISLAVVVTKAERFPQFKENSLKYADAATLQLSRQKLRDADGILADSFLLNEILEQNSAEQRVLMDRYDGNFVNILQNEFRSVRFFWSGHVSETGPKNFIQMTSPLLPILWLLSEQMEF